MGSVKKAAKKFGNFISDAFEAVGDVIQGIGNIVMKAVEFVGDTIVAIIKDPLPTLLQIGGAMIGIPPYVTSAVITAARGGDLGDIAKSAAISYATTEFMSSTQIGADIKNYTSNQLAGDFTDTMMETFNLAPDTAVQIARVATSTLNSSLVGGINAVLTGRSVADGLTSGFTSGLIYSSTDSYFDSLNKDPNWGMSPTALNLIKGAASTSLNVLASGKGDPAQALGNYIAYAAINMGSSKLLQTAKEAYTLFGTDTEAAEKSQDAYTSIKAEYDTKLKNAEDLRNEINASAVDYNQRVDTQLKPMQAAIDALNVERSAAIAEYEANKKIYDDSKVAYDATDDVDTKNALAERANAASAAANAAVTRANEKSTAAQNLYDTNKPQIDAIAALGASIQQKSTTLETLKNDIQAPNANGTNTAAKLKAAADDYQTKYDAWSKTKEAADRSAENYTKAIAEVATRDAAIDALNSGAIDVTGKDAAGNWILSNGMTLTAQGKFVQDGQQLFTNAAGVSQRNMDFTSSDGTNVDFDDSAGRVLSETDVQAICRRDYGFTPSAEETARLAGSEYTTVANDDIKDFADDKVRDTFSSITGKPPTDSQVSNILRTGNVVDTAANEAINGLDLPDNYVFPDMPLPEKISRAQAYATNRALYGSNATFEWNGKLYTTESAEEQVVRLDKAAQSAGKYDTNVVSYAKYKMLDNLSSTDLNPADLTKGEMTQFVDAYSKATPQQRAAMLKGSDSSTFKAIDAVLGETARYNPTGEVAAPFSGSGSGTISAYNPQGVAKILDAVKTGGKVVDSAINLATYDAAGVITRSAQLLRDSLGLDTETADKIQQFWADSKDKSLKSLGSDDQRVVAGGIASGLESIAAFAAAGPIGALLTLGSIAANNSYHEGATTWLDNTGKAYATKEEAVRAAGLSNVRQLTAEENMRRTAVMTSLEIVGEAAGIPGMRLLLRGIPLTGSAAQIVNAVKNFGLGMANEQVSELLTTTAQMSVDKWASFGLNQNATVDDYVKALRDTALATTAAVGTAGSISTATRNMLDLKAYSNPFSTNTGLDSISPTVPSLKDAAKLLGISETEFSSIQRNVQNSVRAGNDYIDSTQQFISNSLQAKGISTVRADAIADDLSGKITEMTVGDFLKTSGIDSAIIPTLVPLITSQLSSDVDTGIAAKNIASIFASSGMDPATAGRAASRFYSYTISAPTLTQTDLDLSNQLLTNAGVSLGSAYKPATGAATQVTPSGATVTNEQLEAAFGTTGSKTYGPNDLVFTDPNAGPTTNAPFDGVGPVRPTDYATTGTLTGGTVAGQPSGGNAADVQTTINNAASNMRLPAGVTPADVATAITNYMTANPGMRPEDVATAVATYFRANPQLTAADVGGAIDRATAGLATKADIDSAIANIQFPVGINISDVTSAISAAMAANPGLTAADVATQISNYMTANPGLTAADVNAAVVNATKDFATKKEIETAISNIQFPAGLTPEDVTESIKAYLTANPALSAADVATQLTNYFSANPTATPADLDAAMAATKTQIADLGTGVNARIADLIAQGLTNQQATDKAIQETKDQIVSLGGNVDTRIAELISAGLSNQEATIRAITETQTSVTELSDDVKTRIADLVAQGLTNQEATNKAIAETQTSVTELSSDVKARIADLVAQGMTNQDATNKAISETQTSITELSADVKLRIADLVSQGLTNQEATNKAIQETQTLIAENATKTDLRIAELIAQGLSNQEATERAIGETREGLRTEITTAKTGLNTRIDELMQQGQDYQTATTTALGEIKATQAAEAAKAEAAAKAGRAGKAQAGIAGNLARGAAMVAPAAAGLIDTTTPGFADIGLKTTGEAKFEGPLEQYLKMLKEGSYAAKPQTPEPQPTTQGAPVQDELSAQTQQQQPQPQQGSDYFNYGQTENIDDLLAQPGSQMSFYKAGGLATPLFAGGGTTRHGRYAGGGLNIVEHAGKARLDFRTGNAVTGAGDGQSDDIPAMLADGEFVFPADVVAALGNGSTKAGSDKLYDMMHSIRAYHRSAKPEDLPPPAKKSPLDYLKKPARKVRR